MKKLLNLIVIIILFASLTGCSSSSNDSLEDITYEIVSKDESTILSNLAYNSMNQEYPVPRQNTLDERLKYIAKETKNLYLIDYIHKEEYYCGYIPADIKEKVNKQMGDLFKEELVKYGCDAIESSMVNRYFLNATNFDFDDIKWVKYNSMDDVLYSIDNKKYYLNFAAKADDVIYIEDIYGNEINQIAKNYVYLNYLILNNKMIYCSLAEKQIQEGKYLTYGYNETIFDEFYYVSVYTQKITEDNLVTDNIGLYGSSTRTRFEYKYEHYQSEFSNIMVKSEGVGDEVIGYWKYEDYKNLILEILERDYKGDTE